VKPQARCVNTDDLHAPNVPGIACGIEALDTVSEVLGASRNAASRIWRHRNKRVHCGARQTLEVLPQRNFEPTRKQVEAWQRSELTDVTAKVVIYEAFVEGKLEAHQHLARTVHDLYFEPKVRGIPAANHLEPFRRFHFSNPPTIANRAKEPYNSPFGLLERQRTSPSSDIGLATNSLAREEGRHKW